MAFGENGALEMQTRPCEYSVGSDRRTNWPWRTWAFPVTSVAPVDRSPDPGKHPNGRQLLAEIPAVGRALHLAYWPAFAHFRGAGAG